jgi:DNA-binding YbaB/EbfC family protein
MKNINQMMKQAQQLQAQMAEFQSKLDQVEAVGMAAAGMVKVTLNGKSEMKNVAIDKSLLNPDEVDILEDLLVAAFNDAKTKIETHVNEEMSKISGGLSLPGGMKLPF